MPPLLELHGDADHTVPVEEGRALTDWARQLGGRVEMMIYPGAGHGFAGAAGEDAERRSMVFLKEALAG